jgi:hypothetical protein
VSKYAAQKRARATLRIVSPYGDPKVIVRSAVKAARARLCCKVIEAPAQSASRAASRESEAGAEASCFPCLHGELDFATAVAEFPAVYPGLKDFARGKKLSRARIHAEVESANPGGLKK